MKKLLKKITELSAGKRLAASIGIPYAVFRNRMTATRISLKGGKPEKKPFEFFELKAELISMLSRELKEVVGIEEEK